MKTLRIGRAFLLLMCACVGAIGIGAAAANSELSNKWLESPAYQRLLSLDILKTLMLPAGDLPVPPGVNAKWTKGLPLILPGEEAVFGGQAFAKRAFIQMHNLETPDGKNQMLNLRVFTATDFGAFYPADGAATAQYFDDVRKVNIGTDAQLMTKTMAGGMKSSSVAFRLGEIGVSATAVIEGDLDGVPLALGAARAWVQKLQSEDGPAREAMDKTVVMAVPAPAPATPVETQTSELDLLADLREAGELGVVNAQLRLAGIYQDGAEGVEPDSVQAAYWIRKAADQGNAIAQRGLGSYYDFGIGVEQDQAEAIRWYKLAAAQDDPPAAYNLGLSYLRGEGVVEDATEAFRYFEQSARLGFPRGQYKLGAFYYNGLVVEVDKEIAAQLYRQAADQGLAAAQNDLGVAYLRGEGVEQNGEKALTWFSKAAHQSHAMGMYNLAASHDTGTGTANDLDQALVWYRRSAEAGYPEAMVELATAYLNGTGLERDEAQARQWLTRAAEAGQEQAEKMLRELDAPSSAPASESVPFQPKSGIEDWQMIQHASLSHTFRIPADWQENADQLDETTIQAYTSPNQIPGILVMYLDIGEEAGMEDLKAALPRFVEGETSVVLVPPKGININSTPAAYMSATMDFAGSEGVADVMCVSKNLHLYVIFTAALREDQVGREANRRILKSFNF